MFYILNWDTGEFLHHQIKSPPRYVSHDSMDDAWSSYDRLRAHELCDSLGNNDHIVVNITKD